MRVNPKIEFDDAAKFVRIKILIKKGKAGRRGGGGGGVCVCVDLTKGATRGARPKLHLLF
jgi:hypothetical protein